MRRILKRLKVWQKLALLGSVFMLPLAVIAWRMVVSIDSLGVDFARQELRGTDYYEPVLKLLRDLQQHRTAAYLWRSGDASFKTAVNDAAAAVDRDVEAVDEADRRLGGTLRTTKRWQELRSAIGPLLVDAPVLPAEEDFERHSSAIRQALSLTIAVGDGSNMSRDPSIDTYYLANFIILKGPEVGEILAQACGIGSVVAIQGHATTEQAERLQRLRILATFLEKRQSEALAKVFKFNPRIASELNADAHNNSMAVARASERMAQVIQGASGVGGAGYYAGMTQDIDLIFAAETHVAAALRGLLDERVRTFRGQMASTLSWAALGLLTVLLLAGLIAQDIARALSQAVDIAGRIAAGNLDTTVPDATRGDEFGILVRAFHSMLSALRERTAQLARQADELAAARDTAEAASKAKSSFLANMSHELRTPLNAILGYAQLLRRDRSLGERQSEAVLTMQRSGEHLLMLITDILDLSKIEAGKLELCPASTDLDGFLRGVADIIRIRAEEKAIGFRFEPAAGLPRFVEFDEKRLRQVLLNLLGNAVKFTDQGEVTLQVGLLGEDGAQARLRFEVRDTGVGIAAAELETIFQPFEQVGNLQRRAGGTGLGLSITRELVKLMGGSVEVSSTPGLGSSFWFELTLPVTQSAAVQVDPARHVTGYLGPRRSLLVADDTAANRAVLVEMLREIGFDLRQAADGREALEQAEAAPPDLVLMDIRMPVMDGLEATRRLRQYPRLQQVPIIGVSAGSAESDGADCLAAGANAFVTKPVDYGQLLREIGQQLRLTWCYDAVAAAPEAKPAAEVLVAPPVGDIETLHQLAVAGNMRGIKQCADGLAARDPRLGPFADKLRQLAQAYQSKAILALVKNYMVQQVES